jgi:hypothetical protein
MRAQMNRPMAKGGPMARWADMVQVQTVTGDPITAGATTVTPQSQAISIRWRNGGLIWHRPVAVLAERDGQTARIPIVDVTRLVQAALLVSVLMVSLIMSQLTRRQKRSQK